MTKIAIIGTFDIHPDDAPAAAELMLEMMTQTARETGCQHYTYSRDLSAANRFQLSELWQDEACLAAHFVAEHMITYRSGMSRLRVLKRTVNRYDVEGVTAL